MIRFYNVKAKIHKEPILFVLMDSPSPEFRFVCMSKSFSFGRYDFDLLIGSGFPFRYGFVVIQKTPETVMKVLFGKGSLCEEILTPDEINTLNFMFKEVSPAHIVNVIHRHEENLCQYTL